MIGVLSCKALYLITFLSQISSTFLTQRWGNVYLTRLRKVNNASLCHVLVYVNFISITYFSLNINPYQNNCFNAIYQFDIIIKLFRILIHVRVGFLEVFWFLPVTSFCCLQHNLRLSGVHYS